MDDSRVIKWRSWKLLQKTNPKKYKVFVRKHGDTVFTGLLEYRKDNGPTIDKIVQDFGTRAFVSSYDWWVLDYQFW